MLVSLSQKEGTSLKPMPELSFSEGAVASFTGAKGFVNTMPKLW